MFSVSRHIAFAGAAALLGGSAAAALGLPIAAPAIPAALAFLQAIAVSSAAAVATPLALAGAANLVTKNVSPRLHRAISSKVNV